MKIRKIEKRIEKVKSELRDIGDMRPGSLNKQYNVCGKRNCKCKDLKTPRKHGPYYQVSYVHKGKSNSQYIKVEFVGEVKQQLTNYKKFKKLTEEWISLALEVARGKLRLAKDTKKEENKNLSKKISNR